ncbi:putative carbonic anhydrase 3 isoform X1 [Drosophila busckii]|uniref:putative carbonic anhydrase 3 isoform X1 n=1 Tax=Drosophila busckii TaxID=30019 RepID=UPI00083F0D50|nr:putative carbonic anhydrase 3 isoform X1 [Drosophila busckii]
MKFVLTKLTKISSFNYDQQGKDWRVRDGKQQSPVLLDKDRAIMSDAPKLSFLNYNKILSGPLILRNNGHTVTMPIPTTVDGTQPAVCGCKLECVYKAVQLHFHWGSSGYKGSEHVVNSLRQDCELHILHQNAAYENQKAALKSPDGFVVLGIQLRSTSSLKINGHALNKVCSKVSSIIEAGKATALKGDFRLRDILAGIDRREFFTYDGSLTTPPCTESVKWFVFQTPIDMSAKHLQNFWQLKDSRGKPLLNNYRKLHSLHNRKVFLRIPFTRQ